MSLLVEAKETFAFASILYNNQFFTKENCIDLFSNKFGDPIIFEHDFFPMKNYYDKEMGNADLLKRLILVSPKLYNRKNLVTDKLWSTEFENNRALENKRTINIDVGYLSLENLVLATGKQFVHRIYLDHGVYADLNLIFEGTSYKVLSWTYPDYAHQDFIEFFNWVRIVLLKKLK
jgi:hypothetical protein